jgi:pantoate--beta-alanine ligase
MLQVSDPKTLRLECDRQRNHGKGISFVPTMGYLHEGHLELVRRARELGDYVVVSIFVNPTQFGPGEDLEQYPHDLQGDLDKCQDEGVSCVFTPERDDIYPEDYQTYVTVEQVSQGLCGQSRPGHFRGVCTVVTKLCNMVGPCIAIFGEKDYQQLQVIRRMAHDLNMPVEVVSCPIVREADGLAMSSRNAYLTPSQRRSATCLYRSLKAVAKKEISLAPPASLSTVEAVETMRKIIEAAPETSIEYVEVCDAVTLEPLEHVVRGRTLMALAVHVGETRLIDNMVL